MIIAQPLTAQGFEAFGQVIQVDGNQPVLINNGTTQRFHDLAHVDISDQGGTTLINLFVGQPFTPPVAIKMMERHPLGSQAFVPLNQRPYLVVVAPNQADNTPGNPMVFLAHGNQGINYNKNTWHHPLISLEEISTFLVVDRGGKGNNLEEYFYAQEFQVAS